jgi:hypothetical protein
LYSYSISTSCYPNSFYFPSYTLFFVNKCSFPYTCSFESTSPPLLQSFFFSTPSFFFRFSVLNNYAFRF